MGIIAALTFPVHRQKVPIETTVLGRYYLWFSYTSYVEGYMCSNLNFDELLTVMILSFRTDMPGQTVQTQIRLLLEEQSDQALHCLPFHLHRLDPLLHHGNFSV